MPMKSYKDNAEFLHLLSDETVGGLKFLTHDNLNPEFDFCKYVYNCQQLILRKRLTSNLHPKIFEIVRGFVWGPEWRDFEGKTHSFFISSEKTLMYYERTGKHPLNNEAFEADIEDFRNSIRFRTGRLARLFNDTYISEFPSLQIDLPSSLGLVDMYTHTGAIRNALQLMLRSMTEYQEASKRVVVAFVEERIDDNLLKSTLSITHVGSFPGHALSRDVLRLKEGNGGTFGTIREELSGLCNWSVITKWPDQNAAIRWRILREETEPEISHARLADGFTHSLTFYHKP